MNMRVRDWDLRAFCSVLDSNKRPMIADCLFFPGPTLQTHVEGAPFNLGFRFQHELLLSDAILRGQCNCLTFPIPLRRFLALP